MKLRFSLILFALLVASCGDWPQLDAPTRSQSAVWPTLLPLDQITGLGSATSPEAAEAQRLAARAAGLRARARIMRQTVDDQEAFDRMRARLSR